MMSDEADLNPYEPPKAELLVGSSSAPGKMPSIVKWTLVYSIFMVIGWIATSGRLIVSDDFSRLLEDPVDTLWMLFGLVVRGGLLIGLTLGIRRPWGHRIAASMLMGTWLLSVLSFLWYGVHSLQLFEVALAMMIYFGMLVHFYRFTFGLTSRTYYGITSVKPDPEDR